MSRRSKVILAVLAVFMGVLVAAPWYVRKTSLEWAAGALKGGNLTQKRHALFLLGRLPMPEAELLLREQYRRLEEGTLPLPLWLETLEAAAQRGTPWWKERLAERTARLAQAPDAVSRYRECLEGGSAAAGRVLFTMLPQPGCIRCHAIRGEGGAIGPDLTGLGLRSDRITTLESIVQPSAVILMGYDQLLLTLKSGEIVAGIRSFESADEIEITSVLDGKKRRLPTSEIAETVGLPSAMPPGFGELLTRRQLRDVLEYVATTTPK